MNILKSNKKSSLTDEISIKTLLDMLESFVKPGIKQEQKFDGLTKEQIEYFFDFLMKFVLASVTYLIKEIEIKFLIQVQMNI